MSAIVTVTEDTLDSQVYAASNVVLLDLWAPWCGPCRSLAPILEKLAVLGGENLKIAKMDVEKYPDAMTRFGIRGIPALLLFKDGQEISRELGSKTLTQLKDWLEKSDVKLTDPTSHPTDAALFGAFYGDPQLKQFFCDRLLAHALRGEVRLGGEPFWLEGVGTPSAAWVHSADPVIFERLTGLQASFAKALDFVEPTQSVDFEPILHGLKPGADLNHVPLQLIQSFLDEALFDWPGLLSQSSLINTLRNEWLELCARYLAGHALPEQQCKDLVLRANTLSNHQDSALRHTAELISVLSQPPKANNADAWTHVFNLANNLVFSLGQHHSGWTLEDRQTEERRFNWFSEKESQTASGKFNDEELEACRALWNSENEAYQLKEEVFFDNQLQGLKPILDCMRSHLATLVHSAQPFNPI